MFMWFPLGKYPIMSNFIGYFEGGGCWKVSTLLYKGSFIATPPSCKVSYKVGPFWILSKGGPHEHILYRE